MANRMTNFVLVKGRLIQSAGVPAYRGLERLRVSWGKGTLRVDVWGHGFTLQFGAW